MNLLARLFGKNGKTNTAVRTEEQGTAPSGKDKPIQSRGPKEQNLLPPHAENLKRWQESGKARAWVAAHGGQWNHADWLSLLDELKRSPFWPMQPDKVGMVLEKVRGELPRRN